MMKTRFAFALLAVGTVLGACTAPSAPPIAGTSAGACDDPLSAAARERGGTGCAANVTQGTPTVVACDAGPQVAYSGFAAGTLGNPQARPIPAGGAADSCS